MSSNPFLIFVLVLLGINSGTTQIIKDYPITPVPFSNVKIMDQFWAGKIKKNHEVTIPIAIDQSEKTGRIDNFRIAGGLKEGSFCSIYPFDDSDIYKIIEAASYSMQTFPDPKLDASIDSLILLLDAAQEEDGYLYTNRTIEESSGKLHQWAGTKRWELVNELSHELYNLGHMYEAAAAHWAATGKKSLLKIAIKSADLVCETFGPGRIENYPGHQEIEIGLVKLYRITKNPKYLETAKYFLDVRGTPGIGRPDKYNQSHIKVTEQKEAVGHSVRAAYMWTAMADVAAITGNKDYINAINTLWHDIVDTKYYINGGIGATRSHEGFAGPYELPNLTAYCETCAGVGNAMWNHRMFLMTGDSKYIDVLERTMYNNILTGVSYSGDRFFYPNPLMSTGQHERSEWFGCACCPPNVARFLPSMPGYIYAQQEDKIFVNLFISSESTFNLTEGDINLIQESTLPWEGTASLRIITDKPIRSEIKLRIPGWSRNQPVPGDLYRYQDETMRVPLIKINGKRQFAAIDEKGYVSLDKKWNKGDLIEIELPMEVQKVIAHPNVRENLNKIAIERGPIVYCAEWPENGTESVLNLVMNEEATLTQSFDPSLFGGIVTIQGKAKKVERKRSGEIEISGDKELKLIPYHLWNNRGPGQMQIWLPTSVASTIPKPAPTIAYKSRLSSSNERSRSLESITDQQEPESSADETSPFFHWWPKKDSWEWVQFDFEQEEKISLVEVYWFDDGPGGGTRLPEAWEIVYKSKNDWLPVKNRTNYPISKNNWNRVEFKSLKTTAIQLKIKLSKEYAAGIHEVIIK